jgi:hypothetical protein
MEEKADGEENEEEEEEEEEDSNDYDDGLVHELDPEMGEISLDSE